MGTGVCPGLKRATKIVDCEWVADWADTLITQLLGALFLLFFFLFTSSLLQP